VEDNENFPAKKTILQNLIFDTFIAAFIIQSIVRCLCDCVCGKDVDEIRSDTSRCEEFMQLYAALKAFVGDIVNLPDPSELFEIFGKVGDTYCIY